MKSIKKDITNLQKRLERLGGYVIDLGKMPLALQKGYYNQKIQEQLTRNEQNKKSKQQSKLMKKRWTILKENKNYGIKVKIKFKKNSPFKGAIDMYRNVTEIHYNYCDGKRFGKKRKEEDFILHNVAFESDIHETGITQQIKYIEEFETKLETKKEEHF